ncbi:hypothetical protein GCM10011491_45920 [Brucella endophytica]|uniref:Uncharacterized protein n=1 Tax=Brucella endophytica TaxID=1963359 RepID=A0A916STG0_9HYPH|nr:hypothetical protein [Brucella endophytica]GGB12973.1 hypothetical protein GCM10011491_45920 [Brucella endophytica]
MTGQLPEPAGIISLTPSGVTKLYLNQLLMVTATVTMTDGASTIPDNAQLVLGTPEGFAIDGNGTQSVTITDADRTQGVATFFLRVTSTTSASCTVYSRNFYVPLASQTWNTIANTPVRVAPVGVSKPYLPVAPDNNRNPSSVGYTTIAAAVVTDPANNDAPVASYVVEWTNPQNIDLFMFYMNTFMNATDTKKLTPSSSAVRGDQQAGYKIYTASDDQGIARLYLVATTRPVSGKLALSPSSLEQSVFAAGNFIVADLKAASAPTLPLPYPEDTNLDAVAGPRVGVDIPDYPGALDDDVVCTLLNRRYEDSFYWGARPSGRYDSSYAKADTAGTAGTGLNYLQYVIGTATGDVANSPILAFSVTGAEIIATPPGVLSAPTIVGAAGKIDWSLVLNPVIVRVPLPYTGNTPAKASDQIKIYANIDAFLNGIETTRVVTGVTQVLQSDIDNGHCFVSLDNTRFQYLGDQTVPPYKKGTADFYYVVVQSGLPAGTASTSQTLRLQLDANP